MIIVNRRDYIILNEIVKNPTIKDKYLIEKLNLTKRKLDYSIEKINDWLELNNIQPIAKKNGKYYFEKEVLKILQVTDEENIMLFHTSRERIELVLLVLLTSKEKILLSKIAEELNVTKNTVLNDIKIAREDLKSLK
ncbi:HTH domain-containing protein [Lactobacillus salivarius]|uniref:Helix-turn-helix type 11 domain-containing protein n=1 Tax=Ligilactobacillus salivarius TaxID=1624 RepID=A0A1V9TLV2_9LACO|nr:HTH domain-containing protein [Ligilactobacillus salivarius]MYU75283.1 HTH domain-containing protein [Ligilactobacillus salivarius]MYU85495.1 HTH domain-containing protein [Ligilactobacillus salivarius]MYU87319.1 HTH domain-containing protein [Ligilactobacillus salivarius]MYZ81202.1 HTH domain-containing protein [Ligilactobacillus salivarius]